MLAQDEEKIKCLIAFKKRMEDQLEKLRAETKEIQNALDAVNSILLDKGFRRGDVKEISETPVLQEVPLPRQPEPQRVVVQYTPVPPKPVVQHEPEQEPVVPLKTMADEPLAIIVFDKQGMHVMPDESKNFSVNTPPFSNFLVDKVFAKMQEKDSELVKAEQLTQDKMFSYNIVREGDLIREITIRNADEERVKELKSSIRWTFEKMYEKMKGAQS